MNLLISPTDEPAAVTTVLIQGESELSPDNFHFYVPYLGRKSRTCGKVTIFVVIKWPACTSPNAKFKMLTQQSVLASVPQDLRVHGPVLLAGAHCRTPRQLLPRLHPARPTPSVHVEVVLDTEQLHGPTFLLSPSSRTFRISPL